jgi:hypothetical protein
VELVFVTDDALPRTLKLLLDTNYALAGCLVVLLRAAGGAAVACTALHREGRSRASTGAHELSDRLVAGRPLEGDQAPLLG